MWIIQGNYLASVVVGPKPHPSMPINYYFDINKFVRFYQCSFITLNLWTKKLFQPISKNFLAGQKAAPGSTPQKFFLQFNNMKLFMNYSKKEIIYITVLSSLQIPNDVIMDNYLYGFMEQSNLLKLLFNYEFCYPEFC